MEKVERVRVRGGDPWVRLRGGPLTWGECAKVQVVKATWWQICESNSELVTELRFKCILTIWSSTSWIQAWLVSRRKEDPYNKVQFPFPHSILSCWRRGQNCQSFLTSTVSANSMCGFPRTVKWEPCICILITQLTNFTADTYRKALRFCNTAWVFLPSQGQWVWDSRGNQQRLETVSASLSCPFYWFKAKRNAQKKKTSLGVGTIKI